MRKKRIILKNIFVSCGILICFLTMSVLAAKSTDYTDGYGYITELQVNSQLQGSDGGIYIRVTNQPDFVDWFRVYGNDSEYNRILAMLLSCKASGTRVKLRFGILDWNKDRIYYIITEGTP